MWSEPAGPFIVVEGPTASLDHALRELTASGWAIIPGFGPAPGSGRRVREGPVADTASAQEALTASVIGGSDGTEPPRVYRRPVYVTYAAMASVSSAA